MPHSSLRKALVALFIGAGASLAWSSESPDAVFDRYVAAVHAGDMAAVRALIAPDVERSDFVGCRPEMNNPVCLAHYIETTVVHPKAQFTLLHRQREGDTVTARLEVRSAWYSKVGVERIVGQDIVRVRDGLIHAFRFVPDFRDEPTAVFFGTLGIGPRASQKSVSK
ncbi:MAG: nuclear transport factor 2 family protein [Burkholderiaceae bacterium]|nr:nuclear transport factor 2 family protein [Burkholderiaceae bacterium]